LRAQLGEHREEGTAKRAGRITGDKLVRIERRKQRAVSRESKQEHRHLQITSLPCLAESREQRAESREQRAESREQRAESREQTADNRQQTADIRQQTADITHCWSWPPSAQPGEAGGPPVILSCNP
jgi:hypothetical protein